MTDVIDRRIDTRGKSSPNRERFIKRIRGHIVKAIPDIVDKKSIKDLGKKKGKGVPIPVRGIKEPSFRQDPKLGKRNRVLPGNDRFSPGDRVPKPKGGGGGCGKGKEGSDSGEITEDDFIVNISRDEFIDAFFGDLELPDLMAKKLKASTDEFTLKHAGLSKVGAPPRLNVIKTYSNALGRNIGVNAYLKRKIEKLEEELEKETDEEKISVMTTELEELKRRKLPFIDEIDLKFDHYELEPKPITSAVMFCIMDVSGSMMEKEKDISKRFFTLLYLFLESQYNNVDLVFIRHHHEPKEVDEEEFFYSRESGGTVVSSALELMHSIRKERYPLSDWNVYCAQCTDGDNAYSDLDASSEVLINRIMPETQYYAYIQINSPTEKNLWKELTKVAGVFPNFQMRHIRENKEIFEVFRDLFKKKNNTK